VFWEHCSDPVAPHHGLPLTALAWLSARQSAISPPVSIITTGQHGR